ncbi:MAG: Hsp20/alpha crystallin family protein [Acidobacteria bacterium]|nr:Hsp20/alpha crystallin family protein [Acidobacteriota bacterium]
MQSQQILQKQTPGAPSIANEAERLFDQMREFSEVVARRAYQFFETRGRAIGHELEDWFRAEAEVLHYVPVEIQQSNEQFVVRAEVPGFSGGNIKVSVELNRLIISGKLEEVSEQKEEKIVISERRPTKFCRVLDLPAVVDPSKASATVKDGVLEITLPKIAPSQPTIVEVKSA